MPTVAELFQHAVACHRAGCLPEAAQIYRQILDIDAEHAEAWHLLGFLAYQLGNHAAAIDFIGRAIAISPLASNYYNGLGIAYQSCGQFDEAVACYRGALELTPDFAEVHNNLGNALRDQHNPAAATASYRRALEFKPDYVDAHYNLGIILREHGNLEDALACCQRAAELFPNHAGIQANLGDILRIQGAFTEAAACYRHAVELSPNDAEAHNKLGSVLDSLGDHAAAAAHYGHALRIRPHDAETHNNLGALLLERGEVDVAVEHFAQAIAIKPDFAASHANLAAAALQRADYEAAAASCRRVLEFQPDYAPAHNNLGIALLRQGNTDEAAACFARALELKPDDVEAWNNLGIARRELGNDEAAEECFGQALDLDPEDPAARFNRAVSWLQRGDFRRGWPEHQWRLKIHTPPVVPLPGPTWEGEPIAGKTVAIHFEGGLGDTLQFIRYAPLVTRRGATVVVTCQPELSRLLQTAAGIDRLVAVGQRRPDCDFHVRMVCLPRIFGTTLETIPADVPYVAADPALIAAWHDKLDDYKYFRIGIVWRGSPQHVRDHARSFPLDCFAPIAKIPGVRLFSLQKGNSNDSLPDRLEQFGVIDLAESFADFADSAAAMANLDLVITCDSSPAHLAGALGRPVWLALPKSAEWRWLRERDDSPWYPTMRLFRQTQAGNWESVFERIAAALQETLR
jgi:tetratricopeptide (TPR) repeat protein